MENVNVANMKQFLEQFLQLRGKNGRIITRHVLFGENEIDVEYFNPIVNDIIGVEVHNQIIGIPKKEIIFMDYGIGECIIGSQKMMVRIEEN